MKHLHISISVTLQVQYNVIRREKNTYRLKDIHCNLKDLTITHGYR